MSWVSAVYLYDVYRISRYIGYDDDDDDDDDDEVEDLQICISIPLRHLQFSDQQFIQTQFKTIGLFFSNFL